MHPGLLPGPDLGLGRPAAVPEPVRVVAGLDDVAVVGLNLTARTSDVVYQLVNLGENEQLWGYVPALIAASIGLVAWELYQRYRRQEITLARLKWMLAKTTGLKAGKLALLTAAMMTPGLNVVTKAALVVAPLYSGASVLRGGARNPNPSRT